MPDATPLYGLPYPNDGDSVRSAVKDIPKSLAQQLEATLSSSFGGLPTLTTWTALPPSVGSDNGGALRPLGYRKVGNEVFGRGRVSGLGGGMASGTVLFTFPVGFRPSGTITTLLAAGNPSYVRADVLADGKLIIQDTINAGGFVNLDDLVFSVDTGTPPAAAAGGTVTGTGIPEGVVTAPVGSRYIDTAATRGAVEWLKITGTGNTGWRVVTGDTGWRQVRSWDAAGAVTGDAFPTGWKARTGNAGFVRIRRRNDDVLVSIANAATTGALALGQTLYALPSGFDTPLAGNQATLIPWFTSAGAFKSFALTPQLGRAGGFSTAADDYCIDSVLLSIPTGAAWPTALPGVAV